MDSYEVDITFYYKAKSAEEAQEIADNVARYVETASEYGDESLGGHKNDWLQAKVGEPTLSKA